MNQDLPSHSLLQEFETSGFASDSPNESVRSFVDVLPWDYVIFTELLPRLPLQSVFILRRVSRVCLECVTKYFQQMRRLDLSGVGTKFTVSSFKLVTKNCNSLQALILCNARDWLSDSVLIPVIDQNSLLQKVDFTNCTTVSNVTINKLAVTCKNLRDLTLRECHWVSPDSVSLIGIHCPKLENLDMTGCWEINDDAVINVTSSCRQLKTLHLAKIYGLSDRSISFIARHCPCIVHINLQGCWRVTDDSIRLLGEYCKNLRQLQVRECRDVTISSIARLRLIGVRTDVHLPKYSLNDSYSKYLEGMKCPV